MAAFLYDHESNRTHLIRAIKPAEANRHNFHSNHYLTFQTLDIPAGLLKTYVTSKSIFTNMYAIVLLAVAMLSSVQAQSSGSITCMDGQPNTIQAADWLSLGDQIAAAAGHSFAAVNDPINLASGLTLDAPSSASITVGTAHAFIQQPSLTQSTHVSFDVFSAAIDEAREQCCGNFATCVGASFNVKGNTGEDVQAGVIPA